MALRELLAVFGVKVEDKELKDFDKRLEGVSSRIVEFGSLLVGAVGAGALATFVGNTVEAAFQLRRTADMLGTSTDELQMWRHSANLAGESTEKFDRAMRFMLKNEGKLEEGLKAGVKEFARWGIQAKDIEHMTFGEKILLFSDKLKGMDSQAKRTRASMAIFGIAGAQVLPWLQQGSEKIKEQLGDWKALGGGMDKEFIEKSAKVAVQMRRIELALTGLKVAIVGPLLDGLDEWAHKLVDIVVAGKDVITNSKLVQATIGVLGSALVATGLYVAAAWWEFTVPLAAVGVFLGGMILLVDDLLVAMDGGKSVIGDWLEKLYGHKKARELLDELKTSFSLTYDEVKKLWPEVENFFRVLGLDNTKTVAENIHGLSVAIRELKDDIEPVVRLMSALWNLTAGVAHGAIGSAEMLIGRIAQVGGEASAGDDLVSRGKENHALFGNDFNNAYTAITDPDFFESKGGRKNTLGMPGLPAAPGASLNLLESGAYVGAPKLTGPNMQFGPPSSMAPPAVEVHNTFEVHGGATVKQVRGASTVRTQEDANSDAMSGAEPFGD